MTGSSLWKKATRIALPGLVLGALYGVSVSATASDVAASRQALDAEQTQLIELGAEIYASQCQPCHGGGGKGDGPASRFVDPKPRDFTSGAWLYAGKGELADLIRVIVEGVEDSAMEPFGELLTEEEIKAAALYVLNEFGRSSDATPS